MHLYPSIEASAGRGSLADLADNFDHVFPALMARADEGFDRCIADTIARMPGKEIWATEWGAFEPAGTLVRVPVSFDGLWFHKFARCMFSMLRHKEVTIAIHHALFAQSNLMSAFRRCGAPPEQGNDLGGSSGDSGDYVPINATGLIGWFCEASRGPDSR